MVDRFVQRNTTPQKPLEDQGVPLAERPILSPSCTCFLGSGTVLANNNGVGTPVRIPAQGHRDPKGRPICQVHFPVSKEEWESRATGGLDDFPRK